MRHYRECSDLFDTTLYLYLFKKYHSCNMEKYHSVKIRRTGLQACTRWNQLIILDKLVKLAIVTGLKCHPIMAQGCRENDDSIVFENSSTHVIYSHCLYSRTIWLLPCYACIMHTCILYLYLYSKHCVHFPVCKCKWFTIYVPVWRWAWKYISKEISVFYSQD